MIVRLYKGCDHHFLYCLFASDCCCKLHIILLSTWTTVRTSLHAPTAHTAGRQHAALQLNVASGPPKYNGTCVSLRLVWKTDYVLCVCIYSRHKSIRTDHSQNPVIHTLNPWGQLITCDCQTVQGMWSSFLVSFLCQRLLCKLHVILLSTWTTARTPLHALVSVCV